MNQEKHTIRRSLCDYLFYINQANPGVTISTLYRISSRAICLTNNNQEMIRSFQTWPYCLHTPQNCESFSKAIPHPTISSSRHKFKYGTYSYCAFCLRTINTTLLTFYFIINHERTSLFYILSPVKSSIKSFEICTVQVSLC
jgi:hypothetical protein